MRQMKDLCHHTHFSLCRAVLLGVSQAHVAGRTHLFHPFMPSSPTPDSCHTTERAGTSKSGSCSCQGNAWSGMKQNTEKVGIVILKIAFKPNTASSVRKYSGN
jgi:hypothetical protein